MGISGHILGPRKLRSLSRLTGLNLKRAYIRNGYSEGIVSNGRWHVHVVIDPYKGSWYVRTVPYSGHWASCRQYYTYGRLDVQAMASVRLDVQ